MWVILPVKTLALSKQRLSNVLSAPERRQLAEAMLQDMLAVLVDHKAVGRILIVSPDPAIIRMAEQNPALDILVEPPHCQDLNEAVSLGVHYAQLHGARRVLILHADIPLLNPADIDRLLASHLAGGITLVPDSCEEGSNGMLLDIPTEMRFCFGPDSFAKHRQVIEELGLDCVIADLADLSLDIDAPEDLLRLRRGLLHLPQRATGRLLSRDSWRKNLNTLEHG